MAGGRGVLAGRVSDPFRSSWLRVGVRGQGCGQGLGWVYFARTLIPPGSASYLARKRPAKDPSDLVV